MKDKMPTTTEEYLERYYLNNTLTGLGIETTMHMPCPFCAAKDFMVYGILEAIKVMSAGATCQECQRSAKVIISGAPGQPRYIEVVQTGGQDQPEWIKPKMRRV